MQPASPDTRKFFYEHLGLNEKLLEQCLAAALSAGGDYADLYFEYITASSLMVDESLVKSVSQGNQFGLWPARGFRRAHGIRLHRRSFSRTAASRRAYCCTDRKRPFEATSPGFSRVAYICTV